MPQITVLAPTTELEAVNAMLSVVGEAPIADEDAAVAAGATDIVMAVNILRNALREVLTMGWRFNTEFGYQIMPTTTLSWPDNTGKTTLLNVFEWPSTLVAAEITQRPDQQGRRYIDFCMRQSVRYLDTGVTVPIFYDRAKNREGWDSTIVPYLYINPTWLFPFEQVPEEARRVTYVRAARTYQQQILGSSTLAQFSAQDEAFALRQLKRAHGQADDYNMLDAMDVRAVLGQRPFITGVDDQRGTPAHS